MIKITNLNKYYKSGQGQYHALKDINLLLPDQGMVFIVGKSGSGKSTLLNIIGGLDSYDSGELWIDETNTNSFKKADYNTYRNTYIGFIFQEFNVIKTLSVYDNVALSLDLHHLKIKEHHQEILNIIEKVGLQGKENRLMNEISGGERQRVAIARALIKNPKVIIADEPTGNLDSKNRDIVMKILNDLSKERLVLIVTHDQKMAEIYGDRSITIKDGRIIDDTIKREENLVFSSNAEPLKPINPNFHTSFLLAWKSFLKNKLRFIFIILLFSFSLIFAGSTVNLYLADPSGEYANYQKDYNNFIIDINQKYTNSGYTANTGFFNYEYNNIIEKYGNNNQHEGMDIYKTMLFRIPINQENYYEDWRYKTEIERIIISNSIRQMDLLTNPANEVNHPYGVYITDYVARCLINYGYFDSNVSLSLKECIGKEINFDEFHHSLYIQNIILTDYETLLNKNMDDSKNKAAFLDNLPYYNAIFVTQPVFDRIVGTDSNEELNIKYTYDDIIYHCYNKKGTYENIKFTTFNSKTMNFVITKDEFGNPTFDEDGNPFYQGAAPKAPLPQQATQMAVSRGFIEKVLNLNVDNLVFTYSGSDGNWILNNEYGNLTSFYICGYRRIPTPFTFYVTGIVEEEDCVIYTPSNEDSKLFSSYLSASYVEGGFPLLKINESADVNEEIYRDMLANHILINNLSFQKLRIVDNFINENLVLFLGLFFVFGLFSILIIFNFIIINIKNSQKDIGIYMSLGMNGNKISLIYLFQVFIISAISTIISLIGTAIFLFILDSVFSSQALINFSVIRFTFLGVLTTMLLAFLTPTLAVIFPLLGLSNKKPIDIIKVS